jgi:hypothetical protein
VGTLWEDPLSISLTLGGSSLKLADTVGFRTGTSANGVKLRSGLPPWDNQ